MCVFVKKVHEEVISCSYTNYGFKPYSIPHDEFQLCVFHSKNKQWKEAENFLNYLEQLIDHLLSDNKQENVYLDDINFSCNISHLFSDKEFEKNIYFKRSFFNEEIKINETNFKNLDFTTAIFEKGVSFKNVSVKNLTLDKAIFKSKLFFDHVNFSNNYFMLDALLHGGISITNSNFHSNAYFERIKTNLDRSIKQSIFFKNVQFKDFSTFESSEFNSMVDFKNIIIFKNTTLKNTQFNYNEPLPVNCSVNFNNINIKKEGSLELVGSTQNKLFDKVVDVSLFNEIIEGTLILKNVDLTKFSQKTRDKLIVESKMKYAKVILGVGCIKYFNQTPIKHIDLDDDNQNLVIELCNTFIEYFTKNGGFNLGVEFVNRTEEHISFFYFSDEKIPFDQFELQLQNGEQKMWQLIKIDNNNLTAKPPQNDLPEKIIHATDTMINLFSLILKIGSRIPLGLINKKHIAHLLNSTLPSNTIVHNGIVVNQIVLFGSSNSMQLTINK